MKVACDVDLIVRLMETVEKFHLFGNGFSTPRIRNSRDNLQIVLIQNVPFKTQPKVSHELQYTN
jgi:hypothetical protein